MNAAPSKIVYSTESDIHRVQVDEYTGPVAYLTGEYPKVSHTFIQREIQALRARGIVVHTFSVRRPTSTDILVDQKSEERDTFYILDNCRNITKFGTAHLTNLFSDPVSYFRTLSLAWRLRRPGMRSALYQLFYFAEAVVFANALRRRGVVHLHNHFGDSSCTVAVLANALTAIPFSFTEHGPNIFFEAERWSLDEKISRAKFVVAISHFCRSQLMLFSRPEDWGKISIVHCGVRTEQYLSARSGALNKQVLFVGRLEPVKGLLVLLDAVAILRPKHPDLVLSVVGDGTLRSRIEADASRLGLSDIVRFVGYKSQAEIAALLAETDMLVLPSFAEGVPVVLMEAMASGRPVVASRVAGVQELVHDGVTGFTVPPGDASSLAYRIDQLLEDRGLSERMGQAGRRVVEKDFNIDHEAGVLAQLFASGPDDMLPRSPGTTPTKVVRGEPLSANGSNQA